MESIRNLALRQQACTHFITSLAHGERRGGEDGGEERACTGQVGAPERGADGFLGGGVGAARGGQGGSGCLQGTKPDRDQDPTAGRVDDVAPAAPSPDADAL